MGSAGYEEFVDLMMEIYSTSMIISSIVGLVIIISLWFILNKAGEPGWAAIVPFYSNYELYKITWGNGWMFLLLLIPLANFVVSIITNIKLATAFGKGGGLLADSFSFL